MLLVSAFNAEEEINLMPAIIFLGVLLISYLVGSIPFGLLIVKFKTGRDIRHVESGRTGGTNVMRAAGFWAGFTTAMLDILKAFGSVYLSRWLLPGNYWLEVLAPVIAILGHNYSIFLTERDQNGRLRLRGGAGGAPAVGGSAGIWFPVLAFIVPIGIFILYFIGYASLATLSVPVICILVFGYRAYTGVGPWEYVAYGVITFLMLAWALRPNIQRLMNGTERVIGYRARRREKQSTQNKNSDQSG